jgi:hypothetical protein
MTNAALEHLATMPKPQWVALGETKISPQALREFRKRRPDVQVQD